MSAPAEIRVWVTIFDHHHGVDVSVYETPALAEAARQRLAASCWDEEDLGDDRPADPADLADEYFTRMEGRESFIIATTPIVRVTA